MRSPATRQEAKPVMLARQKVDQTAAPFGAAVAQREGVLEVAQFRTAFVVGRNRQLAGFDGLRERASEDGKQDFRRTVLGRLPVDIEPAGMRACTSLAQHVAPPFVARIRRHVVGNDVDDQADADIAQGPGERQQPLLAAQLRVDRRRIDHVVNRASSPAGRSRSARRRHG
jgi:hypothetical protein